MNVIEPSTRQSPLRSRTRCPWPREAARWGIQHGAVRRGPVHPRGETTWCEADNRTCGRDGAERTPRVYSRGLLEPGARIGFNSRMTSEHLAGPWAGECLDPEVERSPPPTRPTVRERFRLRRFAGQASEVNDVRHQPALVGAPAVYFQRPLPQVFLESVLSRWRHRRTWEVTTMPGSNQRPGGAGSVPAARTERRWSTNQRAKIWPAAAGRRRAPSRQFVSEQRGRSRDTFSRWCHLTQRDTLSLR